MSLVVYLAIVIVVVNVPFLIMLCLAVKDEPTREGREAAVAKVGEQFNRMFRW